MVTAEDIRAMRDVGPEEVSVGRKASDLTFAAERQKGYLVLSGVQDAEAWNFFSDILSPVWYWMKICEHNRNICVVLLSETCTVHIYNPFRVFTSNDRRAMDQPWEVLPHSDYRRLCLPASSLEEAEAICRDLADWASRQSWDAPVLGDDWAGRLWNPALRNVDAQREAERQAEIIRRYAQAYAIRPSMQSSQLDSEEEEELTSEGEYISRRRR